MLYHVIGVVFLNMLCLSSPLRLFHFALGKRCVYPGVISRVTTARTMLLSSSTFASSCSRDNVSSSTMQLLTTALSSSGNGSSSDDTILLPGNGATVKQAFLIAKKYFEQHAIPESEESARHLICHAATLGVRFSDFNNNLNKTLTNEQIELFKSLCLKRTKRMPIQYIVGNWDFYGMTLQCRPPVLIPRPETEELVEHIINSDLIKSIIKSGEVLQILDVGAGTGAIGLALAKNLPNCHITAIDINEIAVDLANKNAKEVLRDHKRNSSYRCIHTSFKDYVKLRVANQDSNSNKFHLIVSNPPYIPSKDLIALDPEVVKYEDSRALDGGKDGLDLVWDLILHSPQLLHDKSIGSAEMWLEVSREHPEMIKNTLGTMNTKWKFVASIEDFLGNPRFVRLHLRDT